MDLLAKKISTLTLEDRANLFKAIGTPDLPYPGVREAMDANGALSLEIGVIADDKNYISIPSVRPHAQVIGLMYSNMAAPSALRAEREVLEQMRPESDNIVTLILGKPGWGKTQLAENTATLMDDRGFLFMNCAERNLEELLWTTVIDIGEDYKSAIRTRLKSGALLQSSIKVLEEEMPDALIRDGAGVLKDINWDLAAKPKADETSRQAVDRSIKIFKDIAENEGIPAQASNVLGIRKIPGPVKKAYDEGLVLIPDEFTKGQDGSEAQLLELMQWASGMGKDAITIRNTMSVNGRDETAEYTLRRSEKKTGFRIIMTGNLTDPMLQREESAPIFSRIKKFILAEPGERDWAHRISQVMTGVPLSTHYSFFNDMAKQDQNDFSEMLQEWRQEKANAEGKTVPVGHELRLKNWDNTKEAAVKLAIGFHFVERLMNPASDLYDSAQPQNSEYIEKVQPEISAQYAASNPIDPRIFIRLMQQAEQGRAAVQKIDPDAGVKPRFNRRAIGKKIAAQHQKDPLMAQAEFGASLQREIEGWVADLTAGKPELQKAVIKEFKTRGIAFTAEDQDNTIVQLLNQDVFAGVGGIKSVLAVRDALAESTKRSNPDLQEKAIDEIVTVDQAIAALEELTRISADDGKPGSPRIGRVVLPGGSVGKNFNTAAVVDGIGRKIKMPEAGELVSAADFIESLKIPAIANTNVQAVFRPTISAENLADDAESASPIVEIAEGRHACKIGVTTVMMRGANDNLLPVHIMRDLERGKSLIVTDEVSQATEATLGKEYEVVRYGDANAEERVAAFIKETLSQPSRQASVADLEQKLTYAFMLRAGNEGAVQPLARMMTTRSLPVEAPVYMTSQPG